MSDEELVAIQCAGEHLVAGRIAEVPVLLEPWIGRAEYPDTYTLLAQAYVVAGRLPEAEALLRVAIERFPEARSVWKSLAVVYRTTMKPAEELVFRRKLVYLTPDPPLSAYVRLAEAAAAAYKQDPNAAQGDLRFVARKVAAQAAGNEDERRDRFALAQALYQVPELKDEAYRLYAAADPVPPEQHDLGVGWVRLHDWCKKAGLAMQRDENHGRVGHRPTLAELSRVAVLPAFQWMPLLDEPPLPAGRSRPAGSQSRPGWLHSPAGSVAARHAQGRRKRHGHHGGLQPVPHSDRGRRAPSGSRQRGSHVG